MAAQCHCVSSIVAAAPAKGRLCELSLELGIFWEPSPNGTGNYLDMLLSGVALTTKTALLAWIIALVLGTIVGVMRTLPRRPRRRSAFAMSSSSATSRCWSSCSFVLRPAGTGAA